MHKWSIVILLFIVNIPIHAQTDDNPISITPSNIPDITLMAMLDIDDSVGSGLSYFGDNDIEWSPDGEWLGIGYHTMLYVYNSNRLQNSPFVFDLSADISDICGSSVAFLSVRDIAFHPTREIVAVTSLSDLHIYDLQTGNQLAHERETYANDIRFLEDGTLLMVDVPGNVFSVDVDTMAFTPLDGFLNLPGMLETASDGEIYSAGGGGIGVYLTDAATSQEVMRFTPPVCENPGGGGGGCGFLPDDDALATNGNFVAANSSRCEVRDVNIWDANTGLLITELPTLSHFLALSSDGRMIASDGEDDMSMTTLYDTSNGNLIMTLPDSADTVDAEFSPDGSILATMSGESGLVQLWTLPENLPSSSELQSLSSVIVDAECDNVQSVSRGVTISIGWSWYAQTQEQVYDHIENANYSVQVDDILPQRWILLSHPEQYAPHGSDTWTVFYYMPIGVEIAGNHTVSYAVDWTNTITDGFSTFGSEGDTQDLSGSCDYIVRG